MRKNVFGKGETILIDRTSEKLDINETKIFLSQANSDGIFTLSNKEYFYILRKIFHTFMFDMKEFAVDIYDLSVEEYINTLTWLTYIQSLIYKLDLSIEKQASHILPAWDIDLESARNGIKLFLKEHDLFDIEIERCVDDVINYLTFEKTQIAQQDALCADDIFRILQLKSADLEVLRRIILKVHSVKVLVKEMKFFKLLDKIREIFDDIRDYEEDLLLRNFNTVIYLTKNYNTTGRAISILEKYIEHECTCCQVLAKQMTMRKQKKFLAVCTRLAEEKKYYIGQLHKLPRSG